MNSISSRAKEIFFKYSGNHFHMEREGEYTEYKIYKISEDQEYQWIQEYQKELLIKIKNTEVIDQNFNNLCTSIRQYKNLDCLKELVTTIVNRKQILDTFSMLLMIEGILGIVESLENNNLGDDENSIFAKATSLDLLKWLLEKPITVSSKYLDKEYLIDLRNEQQIIDRINEDIENCY